jgi:type II secretory pathway predicted ATPase ExeA
MEAPEFRQLKQRIALRCTLRGFDLNDVLAYINSRMARAGLQNQTVFSPELMQEICLRTQGIPRLINAVCDNILLTCFALETRTATLKMLDEVSADMHLDYPVARPLQIAPNFPETIIQQSRVRFQAD